MNIQEIKNELSAAPKGAKDNIVTRYAALYGVSTDTIYRKIRKVYGPAKKVVGVKKIPAELIDMVGKLKLESIAMGNSERELATEECVQILKDSDVPGADRLTISTVNNRLRDAGFRAMERIVRVEAAYPNQMHQLDFSRSKYFQVKSFDVKKEDYLLVVSGRVLDYKEDDHKLRTWLCGIQDSYSRIAITRGFVAGGESVLAGVEFTSWVYGRERDENSLHFLPKILKIDNGALGKSKSFVDLLFQLQIEKELVKPYKKHGIQKQESVWKALWKKFELPLAMRLKAGSKIYLSEYNDLMFDFQLRWCEREHPIKSGTKTHVYLSGLQMREQREITVDLKFVIATPYKRHIDQSCCVSINKQKYECPSKYIDKWCNVLINANGDAIGELIDEYSKPFPLKAVRGYVEVGDFEHRDHQSYRQGLEEQMRGQVKSEKGKTKREENKESGGVKYLEPRIVGADPETKFNQAFEDEDYVFANVYDAKKYIVELIYQNCRTETFEDYSEVFELVLGKSLKKKEIDSIWGEIKRKVMAL
jgi:hypothetical protein